MDLIQSTGPDLVPVLYHARGRCADLTDHHHRASLPTRVWCLRLLLLAGILQVVSGSALGADRIVLGVHPYQPDYVLQDLFRPLADYLQQTTGLPVEIRVGSNYEDHVHAIVTGEVDLALIGPAGYVNLSSLYPGVPLLGQIVTNGEPVFTGYIVVAADSPLTSLPDVAGHRLAFVDRFSTMYLVPYAMLRQAGLTRSSLSGQAFLGSHYNVALGVLAGDFDAGAIKAEVFDKFADRGLRSLAETMLIPEHVFVAGRGLSPEMETLIRQALQDLGSTADGVAILHSIKPSITAVAPARDADFDPLRALLRFLDEGAE